MKVSRRKMASYFARAAGCGPRAAATALCRAALPNHRRPDDGLRFRAGLYSSESKVLTHLFSSACLVKITRLFSGLMEQRRFKVSEG